MGDQREHPMLMKGPLVVATLEGRKTQTRRLVTPHNSVAHGWPSAKSVWPRLDWSRAEPGVIETDGMRPLWLVPRIGKGESVMILPRVLAGDGLWVREAWRSVKVLDGCAPNLLGRFNAMLYEADQSPRWEGRVAEWGKLRPGIHMPRWACRLELPVTSVRAERVQDISTADIRAEGVDDGATNPTMGKRHDASMRMAWERIWDDINGKREGASFEANPPLWVYEWDKVER